MIWLLLYIAVGVVVFTSFLVSHRLSRTDVEIELEKLANPLPWIRRLNLVDHVVIPVLGFSSMVAIWPVLIYWKIRDVIVAGRSPAPEEKKAFAVTKGNLLQRMAIDEIEREEKVVDPLGAVPDLPFGHLNTAWGKFIEDLQPDDEIWTFSADWISEWGQQERRAGYVIVGSEGPGRYFLNERRIIDPPK